MPVPMQVQRMEKRADFSTFLNIGARCASAGVKDQTFAPILPRRKRPVGGAMANLVGTRYQVVSSTFTVLENVK